MDVKAEENLATQPAGEFSAEEADQSILNKQSKALDFAATDQNLEVITFEIIWFASV